MQTIDIAGIKGMNILNNCHTYAPNDGQLLLGQGYAIFLSFLLPAGVMREGVRSATLNLYKTTFYKESCRCYNQYYTVYPLLHERQPHSERFCAYAIDGNRKTFFLGEEGYQTNIDVTEIMNAWIDEGDREGKLLLVDDYNSNLICYAATDYQISHMRPSISLLCENFYFTKPLSVERAFVKVSSTPKY